MDDQARIEHGSFGTPVAYEEVYRSFVAADCEHRAFVLRAVGIEPVIGFRAPWFTILVSGAQAQQAAEHLAHYAQEIADAQRVQPPQPLTLHKGAWLSTVVYAFVLVLIAYCAGAGVGRADWFQLGALTPSLGENGQWWRAITALTLHADVGHLLGNLAFGGLFGYFAAQLMGAGSAWLSVVLAGALGNLVDSALMVEGRVTIGASTAVFATLGMVAAYAWRGHTSTAARWAHRWAPLIAAVALLAFTGTAGERTDVLAHLTGFGSGALFGLLHAHPKMHTALTKLSQVWTGALACITIVGAWAWAMSAAQ